MKNKLIYSKEFVQNFIISKGGKLLTEEYKNSSQKIKILCSCKRERITTFHDFKRSPKGKCRQCPTQNISEIKKIFEANNCILISSKYVIGKKLEYICSCGKESSILLPNFKNGTRCKNCRGKRISESQAMPLEKVREIFSQNGWELISDKYVNNILKLDAKCPCGRLCKTSLDIVSKGHKCKKCGNQKTSKKLQGNKHYKFDPNLSLEDRLDRRTSSPIRTWRKEVLKELGNYCFCCKSPEKIEVHHIYSYSKFKEWRQTIENGIPLCKNCHVTFHSKYGNISTYSKVDHFLKSFGISLIGLKIIDLAQN